MDRISVSGVRNSVVDQKTRYIDRATPNASFEIKLHYPESEVTKTLKHTDIYTVTKPSEFNLEPINDFVKQQLGFGADTTDDRDCIVHYILNNYSMEMKMEVKYHLYGNVTAVSVEVTSISKR